MEWFSLNDSILASREPSICRDWHFCTTSIASKSMIFDCLLAGRLAGWLASETLEPADANFWPQVSRNGVNYEKLANHWLGLHGSINMPFLSTNSIHLNYAAWPPD